VLHFCDGFPTKEGMSLGEIDCAVISFLVSAVQYGHITHADMSLIDTSAKKTPVLLSFHVCLSRRKLALNPEALCPRSTLWHLVLDYGFDFWLVPLVAHVLLCPLVVV